MPTFRDYLSVLSSRVRLSSFFLDSLTVEGGTDSPKTSVLKLYVA